MSFACTTRRPECFRDTNRDFASQTRMQILNPTPSAVYNGVIQASYRIATGEGFLSLWRGMSSVVVGAGMLPLCLLLLCKY